MLMHFLWDYFKESGDPEVYMMYKELEYVQSIENEHALFSDYTDKTDFSANRNE